MSTFLQDTAIYWIPAVVVLLAAAIRYSIPAVARAWDRHRRGIDKHLQGELVSILANRAFLALYAPASEFMDEHDPEQRRPLHHAWISPYARAVKSTIRTQGRIPRAQRFRARAQVRRASQCVAVRPLTEAEERLHGTAPAAAPSSDHYAVELYYDGHGRSEVERIIDPLKRQLHLYGLEEHPDSDDRDSITLIASRYRIADPLIDMRIGTEFFEEHPASSPERIPMALTATGDPWELETHHTLIYGQTGSGKSGPFLASMRQLAPFVKAGNVKMYGIDPKNDDLGAFGDTGLFERMATDTQEFLDLITFLWDEMQARKSAGLRKVSATTRTPWCVVMIDELFDLRRDLLESREGRQAWSRIERIMAKGRSIGFFIFAATTIADKSEMDAVRPNMVNRLCFRVASENVYMADLMLYKGAIADGYDPTAIPIATRANGHKSSGIGYVMGKYGTPLKIRMAYQSESEMRDYLKNIFGAPSEHEQADTTASLIVEEDLPELEPLAPLGQILPPPLTKRTTREDADIQDT